MSGEIAELINECLFGSGALIGLMVILCLALLVSVKVKFSSSIFIVILLFLAMDYFGKITATSMHAWYFVISIMGIFFLVYVFVRDTQKR